MPDSRIRFKRWNLWTPANITTLGWYDAQDAATIVQADAAGRVSQWTDKGSAGTNHLLQATAANQPTTGAVTISGFNALGFSAASQYFLAMGSNPFGATISDGAIFLVIDVRSVTEATVTFSMSGSSANANRWQSHCPYSDGTCYFDNGGTSGANRVSYATGWAANAVRIMGFIGSITNSVQQIWESGTLKAGDATGHNVSTAGNPTLGAGAGGTEHDTCYIGECIIINGTVSAANRQLIEGYLAWKWDLVSQLPEDHPFKLVPTRLPAA
jgi:hypothetical protein